MVELPEGFKELARFEQRLGGLVIGGRPEPACLWTIAGGYIGPSLLREELRTAETFSRQQAGAWGYVVDTRQVRVINPLNPLILRRIPRLPGISSYVVIAPLVIRVLALLSRWVLRPTAVVATPERALAALAGPG